MIDPISESKKLENKSALEVLKWCYANFDHERIKLSTSFGAEGMVLIDLLTGLVDAPQIFTIDTGRNFQETYDAWQAAVDKYGISIKSYRPDPQAIGELVDSAGPNLFYKSVENRKKCCQIRKVQPLRKALADADAWITGLRRDQTPSREELNVVSFSEANQVYKICPLIDWSESDVWDYIGNNDVPYNKLHDLGYPTVGCQPCSRPVPRTADIRSGRWWWEENEGKECGIHVEEGKIKKKKPSSWSI